MIWPFRYRSIKPFWIISKNYLFEGRAYTFEKHIGMLRKAIACFELPLFAANSIGVWPILFVAFMSALFSINSCAIFSWPKNELMTVTRCGKVYIVVLWLNDWLASLSQSCMVCSSKISTIHLIWNEIGSFWNKKKFDLSWYFRLVLCALRNKGVNE